MTAPQGGVQRTRARVPLSACCTLRAARCTPHIVAACGVWRMARVCFGALSGARVSVARGRASSSVPSVATKIDRAAAQPRRERARRRAAVRCSMDGARWRVVCMVSRASSYALMASPRVTLHAGTSHAACPQPHAAETAPYRARAGGGSAAPTHSRALPKTAILTAMQTARHALSAARGVRARANCSHAHCR